MTASVTLINDAVREVCSAAARAVYHYVDVSGEDPGEGMPECFVPAFILSTLGKKITMTLETNFEKLRSWNAEARKRCGLPQPESEAESLAAIAESIGRPRVDLVLFQGRDRPKAEQDFLAIMEFKRHRIAPLDRAKIQSILKCVDTCPAGATCSIVQAELSCEWLRNEERLAERDGDTWIQCEVPSLTHGVSKQYSVCARVFHRATGT